MRSGESDLRSVDLNFLGIDGVCIRLKQEKGLKWGFGGICGRYGTRTLTQTHDGVGHNPYHVPASPPNFKAGRTCNIASREREREKTSSSSSWRWRWRWRWRYVIEHKNQITWRSKRCGLDTLPGSRDGPGGAPFVGRELLPHHVTDGRMPIPFMYIYTSKS